MRGAVARNRPASYTPGQCIRGHELTVYDLIGRTFVWSLWLPVSLEVVFALGDFSFGIYDDQPLQLFTGMLMSFPLMWVLGMPLTLAVLLIARRSRPLAVAVAAVCGPISVVAFYLSVPLPSFLNTLLGAVPAWLVVLLTAGLYRLTSWLQARSSPD